MHRLPSLAPCNYKFNNVVMVTIGAPRTKQPFPFYLILLSHSPRASQNLNPVHSEILFSQRFFCLPLLFPPCTVPCKIALASPADLGTCPNHFNQSPFIACTKTDIREKAACVRKRKSGKKTKDLLTFVLLEASSCCCVDLLTRSHRAKQSLIFKLEEKFWSDTVINKSLINADFSRSSTGTYCGLRQSHKILSKGRLRDGERLKDK